MNILVTGGCGFMGSAFVRLAVDAGHVVSCLGRASKIANIPQRLHRTGRFFFVYGDIAHPSTVEQAVRTHEVAAIVNLAGETRQDSPELIYTNVLGTQVLLDAAVKCGVRRFVQVSTYEAYGDCYGRDLYEETDSLNPSTIYAASKAAADLIAISYHGTHGLHVNVTRHVNAYGPRQGEDKFIPTTVARLAAGEKVPLHGDGGNMRDWLHVSDHAAALWAVLNQGEEGEVYNVAGNHPLTNCQLTLKLLLLMDKDENSIESVPDRPGHARRYAVDDWKLRNLGWKPQVDFDTGLAETVDWYRARAGD